MATQQQQQQPDYWQMTNKQLVAICKELSIHRWSGKRKKDLIAMIKQHIVETVPVPPPAPAPTVEPTPLPSRPATPLEKEPYEFLDETLMEHANRARAFLPKSPTNEEEEPIQEWSAPQTTPATVGPIVRLPVGMAAISLSDIANIRFIEY
jgi:hypothetical protein